MAAVRASLNVRRSRGVYRGWALGEILRHGHRTGSVDGISYLDYLAHKGDESDEFGPKVLAEERDAAAIILAHLEGVPELDADAYAAEFDRLLPLIEEQL